MAKRCPPGVICIENITIIIILLIIGCVILFLNLYTRKPTVIIKDNEVPMKNGLFPRPSFSFSNISSDVLMNPYKAPLKEII